MTIIGLAISLVIFGFACFALGVKHGIRHSVDAAIERASQIYRESVNDLEKEYQQKLDEAANKYCKMANDGIARAEAHFNLERMKIMAMLQEIKAKVETNAGIVQQDKGKGN
jgi:hypothetical protein